MKAIEQREDEVVISLSNEDLDLIIAGLRETLQELEDWEFETRTGFRIPEWRQFLEKMLTLARREH